MAVVAALAVTLPTGNLIQPVGEVRGAAATPLPAPVASPSPWFDSRFAYDRTTEREGPRTGRDALAPQPGELTGYAWPLAKGRITLPFKEIPGGSRIRDGKRIHDGLDIASFCGDTVRAAHDGVVLAAGRQFDDVIGWVGDLSTYYRTLDKKKLWDDLPIVVVVDDGNGYRSIYAHMRKVTVRVGDKVIAGKRIGYEGATGHASGCHVHYGLFSPFETDTFGVREDILKRLNTPPLEIARIDPLWVLPNGEDALRTRRVPQPAPPAPPAPAPTPASGR
ncbi:MAG TPA: M23 family metallopeptidase [Candidatus Limnocylindrales bacterium]|nr:M23 family metallopeptidase [Candidatus Limnocylindrales bacterium]